jgi:O-6-methylguanine DNA methyltransferase
MNKISYKGYKFPPEIIQQAIWLYLRFTLSFRDVEDLLSERGITVSYETIRRWVNHFGPTIAVELRKRRPRPHTIWHLGSTVSYAELAQRIREPKAVRAVAGACAANKIAVAIPCHRVVRNDGALSGYRWGVERKRMLLDREAKS